MPMIEEIFTDLARRAPHGARGLKSMDKGYIISKR